MRTGTSRVVGLVMILAAMATVAAAGDDCCFTNTRYTGVCRVAPGEDESCADILAYLNDANSVGKSYCGNTIIRGGWAQGSCDEGDQRAACGAVAVEPAPVAPDLPPSPPAS